MRERWKALDTLSGPAPRSLWERFDAACSAAYAPAAAHFRQLADERHANAARGQALVDEAQAEIANLQQDNADWKHVSATVQRLRTAWSHLGAVDRKEKKRLDGLFSEALTTLQRPLENQRKVEVAVREQLIEEVHKLDPNERHAVDMLRELQSRWQEHARALPLERKAEQALWQRFRAACDALFAARKEHAHAADSERRTHEAAKEALCARLEAAALDATPSNVARMLREAAAEWQAIGPVTPLETRPRGAYRGALPGCCSPGAGPGGRGAARCRHGPGRRRARQAAYDPGARNGARRSGQQCRHPHAG
jgi:type I site-specific restriction endonuclease